VFPGRARSIRVFFRISPKRSRAKQGLRVLTMVPRIKAMTQHKAKKTLKATMTAQGQSPHRRKRRRWSRSEDSEIGSGSEQYQILATRLRRGQTREGRAWASMVTSAAGCEGKTLTSVIWRRRLAAAGAQRPPYRRGSAPDRGCPPQLSRTTCHGRDRVSPAWSEDPEGDLSKYAHKRFGGHTVLPGQSSDTESAEISLGSADDGRRFLSGFGSK
jgi:hypothetical protein